MKRSEQHDKPTTKAKPPRFAPAGQSTQMIIGADAANDQTILHTSANLYGSYKLKRVYYSAFSPIPDASRALPLAAPPLVREHRLYQADWLMRFYGFDVGEIVDETAGMLPLDIDPKLAWALRHRDRFPLDVNRASREDLLRVPGFGRKAVDRIIATRRVTSIRAADLARLHIPRNKALPFIVLSDHRPSPHLLDGARLAERFKPKATQLGFGFSHNRHGRACPGHPRLCSKPRKTWMPGTRPGMTKERGSVRCTSSPSTAKPISTAGAKRRERWC